MHCKHSHINFAKYFFALLATAYLLGFGLAASAETLSTELAEVSDTATSTALPGAIEIEGDKLDLYLDRKMRASGNAQLNKSVPDFCGRNRASAMEAAKRIHATQLQEAFIVQSS